LVPMSLDVSLDDHPGLLDAGLHDGHLLFQQRQKAHREGPVPGDKDGIRPLMIADHDVGDLDPESGDHLDAKRRDFNAGLCPE